jgi:ATP-dependent protease ClpP protease subunit
MKIASAFRILAMTVAIGVSYIIGGCFLDADLGLSGGDTSLNSEYGHDLSGSSFISGGILNTYIFARITSVTSYNFIKDIRKVEDNTGIRTMRLFINSRGGSLTDSMSIVDTILQARGRGWTIEAHVSGIVASAAVSILAVCYPRYASKGSFFMVHEAAGSSPDLIALARMRYITYIIDNSHLSYDYLSDLMVAETFFGASQALSWGLIDDIR